MDKDNIQKEGDALEAEMRALSTQESVPENPNKVNRTVSPISGLCLGLTLLIAALTAWLYQHMHQELSEMKQTISQAQNHLQALTEKTESSLNNMHALATDNKAYQAKLEKHYADIEKTQAQLVRLSGTQDWVLNEAYYLVKNAAVQLQVNQDIQTAIAQLRLAEHKISELGALSSLGNLRTTLLKDIAALQAAPVLDKQGFWAKLNALETLYYRLKFKAIIDENQPKISDQVASSSDAAVNWPNALKNAWQEFSSLVKITRYDQDVMQPVLTQLEQEQILRALELMTEEAKWAVLKENTIVYHESLNKIAQLVRVHFEATPSRETLLASIDSLGAVSLQHVIPDITESLEAFQAAVDKLSSSHRRQETAP